MTWKFISFIVSGYLGSQALYRQTHGRIESPSLLPESVGLVLGGLLVIAAFVVFNPDDEAAHVRLVAAFAAVGIGVGISRVQIAMRGTDGRECVECQ